MTAKKFTKAIANDIAATSICYVLESILDRGVDGYQYGLDATSDQFTTNFSEDIENRGFTFTEKRLKMVCDCFDAQLEKIRNQVEKTKEKIISNFL